ncbi:MAG: HAMP domain-containing histidine kinase [Clostridia bacterium]|nr:HAMP domain-containing histidine kinase [Clostridia bacterium]
MKNLYLRLFSRILLILLCCVAIIMITFFSQVFSYSERETRGVLKRDADRIAYTMALYFSDPSTPLDMLSNIVLSVTEESESQVMIVNSKSEILFRAGREHFEEIMSSYTYSSEETECIESEIIDRVIADGTYSEVGTLHGYYPFNVYTVGVPVFSYDQAAFYGVVLLSTQKDFLRGTASDIGFMGVISLALSLAIALVLAYFMTKRIVKPINDMSLAAKAFSRGDFSARVNIRGSDEIAALGRAFNEMALSLEKTENTRQQFITDVTHELKTPMTSISGFVDGILDGTIPPDRQKDYLLLVSDETRRLSRMVSQTLLASRLSSGEKELHLTEFDLGELLRRTFLGFEQLVDKKALACEVDIPDNPVTVRADEDAIVQVLYNLIDNAIKYAFFRGKLRLTLKKSGDKAAVEIYNTGNGIDKEELPFIFDRFYKADQSRGIDRESFGLGLYIVKAIINKHGENIRVESEKGVYCAFFFELPLA